MTTCNKENTTSPRTRTKELTKLVNEIVADYLHNDNTSIIPLIEGKNMKNYEFVITNEHITDAKDLEEFTTIFNDKLATLQLLYEKILGLK